MIMSVKNKFKPVFQERERERMNGFVFRKRFVISLLFMIVLVSSSFVSAFSAVSPFVLGVPDKIVNNEFDLKTAITNAEGGVVIALDRDISIVGEIVVPNNKVITLTSNRLDGFYKLISAGGTVVTVEAGGVLKLDGVVVTHENGASGRGVIVNSGGTLLLYSGEISGNTAPTSFGPVGGPQGFSGGVQNSGTFVMYGGKISDNRAVNGAGGGVGNSGVFEMYGGEISNNNAPSITSTNAQGDGGGVANGGTFSMFGGEICNNRADFVGGGVWNGGAFTMSGGTISGNTAGNGGGVYSASNLGVSVSGGVISNNRASIGGGIGVYGLTGLERVFVSDGVVFSNNKASTAYNRASTHDALYNSHIGVAIWTSPFTQGYNNYDIGYTSGVPLVLYEVTVHDSSAVFTGTGNYVAGEPVTVNAGAWGNYVFDRWIVEGTGVVVPNSAIVTFIMPANNVVFTAVWVATENEPERVTVGTETALRNAINNANSMSAIITLNADIQLTGVNSPLIIPAGKAITLATGGARAWNLTAMGNFNTIIVERGGVLTLDGICVNHVSGVTGMGVNVVSGGALCMNSGIICDNGNYGNYGGGVNNSGNFTMLNGEISGNIAGYGGGVYNLGIFHMFGGKISDNTATNHGGGVYTSGILTLHDGLISNNIATSVYYNGHGGGVYNTGIFEMVKGEISGNTASGTFSTDAIGGGVYTTGTFSVFNGAISNNKADYGGGVYTTGTFSVFNGVISGNTATKNGGGIGVPNVVVLEKVFIYNAVVFSNNRAAEAYTRASIHDSMYNTLIGSGVVWTAPFTQGYNNYDIGYTSGTVYALYTVNVQNSFSSSTGAGNYLVGVSVTVYAGTRDGYTFSGWTVNEGTVSLANSATATFTMPTRNVAVTANWTPTSTGGSGSGGSGGGGSSNGGSSGGSSLSPSPSNPTPSRPAPSEPVSTPTPIVTVCPPPGGVNPLLVVAIVVVVVGIVGSLLFYFRKGKK